MKLLVVAHSFLPSRNARAFRWGALTEYWAKAGHQVQVVTGALPGLPASEVINGVRVHRVGGSAAEMLRSRIGRAGAKQDAQPDASRGKSLVGRIARVLHDLTWRKIYWPDYAALWIRPAARLCRQLLAADPDQILVSVSLPFSGHVAAYLARRKFRSVPWVMDIGDPFAFMVEAPTNNHLLYGTFNFFAEGRMLSAADAFSVTTENTLKRYVATFPQVEGRIEEIPPMVNLPDIAVTSNTGPVRLVFLGTMYKNVRGPERMLSLFRQLVHSSTTPLELHLYGNHSAYAEMFSSLPADIRDNVFVHGLVDRSAAYRAMAGATALVNIGNETTYQLPSKLVEYAAFSKPIINVVSGRNDSSIAFLKQYPCVHNVIGAEAESQETASAVLSFLNERDSGKCTVDPAWLDRFSLRSVANRYESLFAGAATRHARVAS